VACVSGALFFVNAVKFYRQTIGVFSGFEALSAVLAHNALQNGSGAILARPNDPWFCGTVAAAALG
jgi:hypothetical protein